MRALKHRAWLILAVGLLLVVIVDRVYVFDVASYSANKQLSKAPKVQDTRQQLESPVLTAIAEADRFIERHDKLFIVLLTGAIALFTATLWRATDGLFEMAKKQSQDMQKQLAIALLQTRAAVAAQIPVVGWAGQKLVAYDANFNVTADPAPLGLPPIISRPVIAIKNSGPTKILVFGYCIRWEIAKRLPPKPVYDGMAPTALIIEDGQTHWFTNEELITIEKEQMNAIERGDVSLWIYGHIRYGDFLDEAHELGFCFRWQVHPARGFVLDGPEAYAYSRHEKSYTKLGQDDEKPNASA